MKNLQHGVQFVRGWHHNSASLHGVLRATALQELKAGRTAPAIYVIDLAFKRLIFEYSHMSHVLPHPRT